MVFPCPGPFKPLQRRSGKSIGYNIPYIMSKEAEFVTRQDFLRCLAITTGSAVLPACASELSPETPKKRTYQGPVVSLQGKELFPSTRLEDLLNELNSTKDPFLAMIVADLQSLTTSFDPHPELPGYVQADSYPLAVTADGSNTSTASVGIAGWSEDPDNQFLIIQGEKLTPAKQFTTIAFGINLGINQTLAAGDELIIALFLAKEHLSHMTGFKAQQELAGIFSQIGITILNLDKQPITDEQVLQKICASVFVNELTDKTSDLWKIFDIFPMLLLGESILSLVGSGQLPRTPKGKMPLYIIAKIIEQDPLLRQALRTIRDDWIKAGTLLPPDGTTLKTMQKPINPAIQFAYQKLYGTGYNPFPGLAKV